MKRIVFICAFFALHLACFSQNCFPTPQDNPLWIEWGVSLGGSGLSWDYYRGQVTICGYDYGIMSKYSWDSTYYRSDSIRVYARKSRNCSDKEYVVYDFSAVVGDTVYVPLNASGVDTMPAVVLNVTSVMISGVLRQVTSVSYPRCGEPGPFTGSDEWIYGIGGIRGPRHYFGCTCDLCEYYPTLVCLETTEGQIYLDQNNAHLCDTTLVSLGHLDESQSLEIGPNPFGTNLSLRNTSERSLDLELSDLQGRLLERLWLRPGESKRWSPGENGSGIFFLRETESGQVYKILRY